MEKLNLEKMMAKFLRKRTIYKGIVFKKYAIYGDNLVIKYEVCNGKRIIVKRFSTKLKDFNDFIGKKDYLYKPVRYVRFSYLRNNRVKFRLNKKICENL